MSEVNELVFLWVWFWTEWRFENELHQHRLKSTWPHTHTHTHTRLIWCLYIIVFHLWCVSERSCVWAADRNSKLTAAHLCDSSSTSTLRVFVFVVVQRLCVWSNCELQQQKWSCCCVLLIMINNYKCIGEMECVDASAVIMVGFFTSAHFSWELCAVCGFMARLSV